MAAAAAVPKKLLPYDLYVACQKGDAGTVRSCLNDGVPADWINKRDRNRSLLMATAWKDAEEACRMLIDRRAPLDCRDASGLAALHICAKQNSIRVAKQLLKAGANVNLLAENDVTALMVCVDFGHTELARVLLDQPNIRLDQQSSTGFTALMKSVFENRVTLAYLLVDRGARLDLASRSGFTALHLCGQLDRREIAQRILAKATPDLINRASRAEFKGNSAFALAALNGHVVMLRLLYKHNADPNLTNSEGCTTLDQVKIAGGASPELLRLLRSWSAESRDKPERSNSAAVDLTVAIQRDNLDGVRSLVLTDSDGAKLATELSRTTGQTPLMLAAGLDKPKVMKLLLEAIRSSSKASFHVNQQAMNSSKVTALHAAVQRGSEQCVRLLLAAGASATVSDVWGSTPLHLCADLDSAQPLANLLISRASADDLMTPGRDGPPCPAKLAAVRGHVNVLRPMLDQLLQLDFRRCSDNWLPQICEEAKRARQLDAVNVVLEFMPKTQQNNEELTIAKLFKASMDGHTRKVRELLDSSKTLQRSINERSKQDPGWTPLMATAWNDDEATCKLLLERGANPNVTEQKLSTTALHIAVQQDSRRVARILLDQKFIGINATSSDSQTPLIRAAWLNHLGIAKLLLDKKANVNAQEIDGFSALHFCAQENLLELAKLLVQHNAELELQTSPKKNRNTAFTLAAVKGHADMLELLANVGANIYHRSSQGDALELARRANRTAAIEVLIQLYGRGNWEAAGSGSLSRSRSSLQKSAGQGRYLEPDILMSNPARFSLWEPDYTSQSSSVVPPIRGYQYSMRTNPRGICVIINNETFVDGIARRSGSKNDVACLERLFRDVLKFRVQVHHNMDASDMLALMRSLAVCDRHTKFDCFAAFIMSHGEYDRVQGSDGKRVALDDIFALFQNCHSLLKKPKLFFVQACRNLDMDEANVVKLSNRPEDHNFSACKFSKEFSNKMDFLYAYAVTKGDYALRCSNTGSLYIQTLCNVIGKNYKKQHLCSMLNMVRCELGRRRVTVGEQGDMFNLSSETTQLQSDVWFKDL